MFASDLNRHVDEIELLRIRGSSTRDLSYIQLQPKIVVSHIVVKQHLKFFFVVRIVIAYKMLTQMHHLIFIFQTSFGCKEKILKALQQHIWKHSCKRGTFDYITFNLKLIVLKWSSTWKNDFLFLYVPKLFCNSKNLSSLFCFFHLCPWLVCVLCTIPLSMMIYSF